MATDWGVAAAEALGRTARISTAQDGRGALSKATPGPSEAVTPIDLLAGLQLGGVGVG